MQYLVRTSGFALIAALATAVTVLRPDVSPHSAVVSAAQPAELTADLALVPADAVGFVHLRLADLWKNDVMDGFRKTWEKAGPKALAALDEQFVPAPSTLSRGTMFVIMDEKKGPLPVAVLAFSAPFDPSKVVNTYLPKHNAEKVNGKSVYRGDSCIELYFPDNKHIVMGFEGSLAHYLAKAPAKTGPLASAIKLANSGTKVMVACADISALPIPPDFLEQVPAEARPILKAKQLTIAVDLGANAQLDLRATYANNDAAQDAEKAIKSLAELGRKELAKLKTDLEGKLYDPKIKAPRPAEDLPEALAIVFGIGAINRLDDTLADPKLITRNNAELSLALPMPKELLALGGSYVAIGAAVLLPAVQKVREAAARMSSSNNLKQIGLAIHNYESAYGHLPHDIVDKNGKPLLSWRVAILPYMEQDNLYKLFKLDEPWDSDNNKKASQVMIKTFLSPNAVLPGNPQWGLTSYRGISGPGAAFETGKKLKFVDFTDGTSNTILAIETDELVPWAKPGDFPFDPKKALPKIVPVGNRDIFQAVFADGSVRAIRTNIDEKILKATFTRNGGEVNELDKK